MVASGKQSAKATVHIDQLNPGWLVDHDIFHGTEKLVAAGVTLTQAIISSLERRGITLIQVARESELVKSTNQAAPDALTSMIARTNETYELHNIECIIPQEEIDKATNQVEGFFHEIELGEPVNIEQARTISSRLVSLFTARSHLAIKLLDIDRFDRYTYRHSINVGILLLLIASEWVDSTEELEELVLGAILHDLGKAKVGSEIINKPGKLTDDEWDLMRKHPIWSAELLEEAGATRDAIEIARWHHERLDGTGYPDGIPAEKQSRFVRLSAICDVYDALTTERSYKSKMDFARAIDVILRGCGTHFDPDVAHAFIRRVGRYPVGTFVLLSTGDIAVVRQVNEKAISRPVVSRVVDGRGLLVDTREDLDLYARQDIQIQAIIGGQGSV
jgi:putative nucleotidyltransferase with HDIG domain